MVDPFQIIDVEINDIELKIPVIIYDIFNYIEDNITEGIFRINGSLKKINQYYSNLSKYPKFLKHPDTSIYDICSLIKKILNSNYQFVDSEHLNLTGNNAVDIKNFNNHLNTEIPSLSINIFIFVINKLHNFLKYHDETKMTIMNYSIIFQPILISSDNLLLLPNFINLLKSIIENKEDIKFLHSRNSSIISNFSEKDFERGVYDRNNNFIDSNFFKNFKSFKNKSFDTINDSLKMKLTQNKDFLKLRSKMNSIEDIKFGIVEEEKEGSETSAPHTPHIESSENPETPENEDSHSEKSSVSTSHDQSGIDQSGIDQSFNASLKELPLEQSSPLDEFSETFESPQSHHDNESIESDESIDLPQPSLAPLSEKNQYFLTESPVTKPRESMNSINELCKLDSINSKSFQFNINLDSHSILSNSSYHSIDNHNDTTFDTIDTKGPVTSSDCSIDPKELPLPESPVKKVVKSEDKRVEKVKKNRNSILFGDLSPLNSNVNKRKSFISLFKNDGVKRNFTLKFKNRSVY
ncbi:hypothetical protein CLIB1444_12S01860 [[Candida] jaroonii]|uniref:Uncharacterized protein n=1 Tax=[Candida] jaroonii TaxID=467808 RepID=A0ACA9YE55_9ASCO|nr:hypothetical protein CLIB1444_12S01860 [[Candida] jaroonii]